MNADQTLDRRTFLAGLASAGLAGSVSAGAATQPTAACWLDVAAPFVAIDPSQGLATSLLLTATCFGGVDGFSKTRDSTEYQILLYDNLGREIPLDNRGRLDVPAMRPTLVNLQERTGRDSFFGGAKIRVAPSVGQLPRAGDLFSAGFVRWDLPSNFDNIHAHPAAPQQMTGQFNYSMPFPALSEYHCAFALFNPGDEESYGTLRVVDRMGRTVALRKYELAPHRTMLFGMDDLKVAETPAEAFAIGPSREPRLRDGGTLVVKNDSSRVAFAYGGASVAFPGGRACEARAGHAVRAEEIVSSAGFCLYANAVQGIARGRAGAGVTSVFERQPLGGRSALAAAFCDDGRRNDRVGFESR